MTTLIYLSHAIDCQKECQNQQINHFKAINVSTIMQSCVDACGKAAKKHPTYLLKKKKKIQSIPGSVIPTINILDNTSDTTCVELALMLAWWRGACGTTIGCKTSIMQIRLNSILHSYYCSNVTWQSPLKTQSSTLKLLRIQAQVARIEDCKSRVKML